MSLADASPLPQPHQSSQVVGRTGSSQQPPTEVGDLTVASVDHPGPLLAPAAGQVACELPGAGPGHGQGEPGEVLVPGRQQRVGHARSGDAATTAGWHRIHQLGEHVVDRQEVSSQRLARFASNVSPRLLSGDLSGDNAEIEVDVGVHAEAEVLDDEGVRRLGRGECELPGASGLLACRVRPVGLGVAPGEAGHERLHAGSVGEASGPLPDGARRRSPGEYMAAK